MKTSFRSGLAAGLLLVAGLVTSLAQAAELPGFRAVYQVSAAGLTLGRMTVSLERQDSGYVYSKDTETEGLMALFRDDHMQERSEGVLANGRVQPQTYFYLHERSKGDRREEMQIGEGMARGSYRDRDFERAVPADVQDRASMELYLMQALQEGRKDVTVPVMERGKLKSYHFRVEAQETVEVPAGEYDTLRVRILRETNPQVTVIWLAQQLHYLPVRIEHQEDEDETPVVSVLQALTSANDTP